MKTAIECYNCYGLTRFSESYSMRITKFKAINDDPMAEVKEQKIVVRVCKKCAKKAGYHVSASKKRIGPKEDLTRMGSKTLKMNEGASGSHRGGNVRFTKVVLKKPLVLKGQSGGSK